MAADIIEIGDELSCCSYGPSNQDRCLLAIGARNELYIISCSIKDDDHTIHSDVILRLACCKVGRVRCISWSPSSSSEQDMKLALAGSDHCIYLLQVGTNLSVVGRHEKYINSITFHSSEELIASVGDDLVCKVWDIEKDELMITFQLLSPGVSVSFHDSYQLLVTERQGRIRLYNTETKAPIISLESTGGSLLQSDWSSSNNQRVCGVGGSCVYLWDLSQSSLPYNIITLVDKGLLNNIKWCTVSDNLFAVTSNTGLFQVHHLQYQKKPVSCIFPVIKDISWHPRLPIVSAITNNKLFHWMIQI